MFQKILSKWFKPDAAKLGYDAAFSGRVRNRRYRNVSTLSEDKELRPLDRQSLISEGRDLLRNFALAGFVLRKHLQFVSDFSFEGICSPERDASPERKQEIDDFNIRFENKMKWWSKRQHCDIAKRHCFSELLELIETHRVFDGDCGVLRVSGGRIQVIEGDRIRNPVEPGWTQPNMMLYPNYEWIHGVKVGRTGQAFRYAISRRMPEGGFQFEREVNANNLFLTGYFTRIDQIRGVAKMAPAINFFSHLYEGLDYALAKAKLGQLLGIFSTHAEDDFEEDENGISPVDELTRELIDKFGPETAHIVGKPKDTLQMIASNTPSNEFQNFCVMTIRLVFAALDIPYSFFDGSAANYYGQKGELDNYVDSCNKKQTDMIELLEELTDWLLREWVGSGELELPAGYTLDDVRYEWTGAGLPAWRMIDDAKGYMTAVMCGFESPVRICKSHRSNVWKNLYDMREVFDEARRLGLNLAIDPQNAFTNIGT
jgi:capsid protein